MRVYAGELDAQTLTLPADTAMRLDPQRLAFRQARTGPSRLIDEQDAAPTEFSFALR
jgi:hypothetical protein